MGDYDFTFWDPSKAKDKYAFEPGAAEKAEVDTGHLKNVIPILEDLKHYVENRLTLEVAELCGKNGLGGDPTVAFGKFTNATEAASTHKLYMRTVHGDYTNLAKNLDTAITATRQIVKNYDDAEELNAASAADVAKAFSATGSSSSSSSSSTSSSDTSGAGF